MVLWRDEDEILVKNMFDLNRMKYLHSDSSA